MPDESGVPGPVAVGDLDTADVAETMIEARKEQDRQFLLELGCRQVRGVQCFIRDHE
ncbi:MAG: hypothetical protein AADX96_11825 [Thiocapsa sp. C3-sup]|uniref:hypothetical protein n=1 Tax=unclassified Thiocapsa TaxID=2641286 RepID=UPI0035B36896